ncbi:protein LURP-one-related 7 [Carica papaya]|uniref:protein LURP-one-related 7 n=1 Tax=Carica papaya TaxID=3649 RepID=UPI000B8D1ADE|nr:protein LURP-one-related 7 [Carica papaya]
MAELAPMSVENSSIPVDLFASKKHPGLPRGDLGFSDSSGNIVFRIIKSSSHQKSLLDSTGNPVITISRHHDGSWQGFKGNGGNQKELIFRAKRTVKKCTSAELEVSLVGENVGEESIYVLKFKIQGSPFQKSCTIYQDKFIIAQTSLMYKLRQICASRSRFRLTIFPGPIDHALIVAMVVVFLNV